MKLDQTRWTSAHGWMPRAPGNLSDASLVLAFGSRDVLKRAAALQTVRAAYPNACIIGSSTSGEILGTEVTDESLVVTAIRLETSHSAAVRETINTAEESFAVGERLAQSIPHDDLIHTIVFSDGSHVNGSELVAGIAAHLPPNVPLTGGLAGDADRFEETYVIWDGVASQHTIVLLGLYGKNLRVGFGSLGGWDTFGAERTITHSHGNILYELDGQSALALYKTYLGAHAQGLPATAFLFPLSVRTPDHPRGVVRTILNVSEADQSMTFAGDMPEGGYARLMKANFRQLIDGAEGAARTSYKALGSVEPEFALLISCVGRKIILKQRVEDEVEAVREVLGAHTPLTGFYSYGEISPLTPGVQCELHNQTMTIIALREVE
jgi:hypothetical protein